MQRPQLKDGEKDFFISWAIPGSTDGPDRVVVDLQQGLVKHLETKGFGNFWVKCYKKQLSTGWTCIDLGPDVYFPDRKWAVYSFFTSGKTLPELKAEANSFIGPYHNEHSLEVVSDLEGQLFSCPFGFTQRALGGDSRSAVQQLLDGMEDKKRSLPGFLAGMAEDELEDILQKATAIRSLDKRHRDAMLADDLRDLKKALQDGLKAQAESSKSEPDK